MINATAFSPMTAYTAQAQRTQLAPPRKRLEAK
jgi:hypothetical protein